MSLPLQAALWGLLGGGALVLGAATGYAAPIPRRWVSAIMAFGSGVLISALAFELMAEAHEIGGLAATASGFMAGAIIYTLANLALERYGAAHRKRSGDQQAAEADHPGSGSAIAIGSLLDGIPESIAIGLSLLQGGSTSLVMVAAVFLSNIPEGLASAAGMKRAGRSPRYVFSLWLLIALCCSLSAGIGAIAFADASDASIALIMSIAAGAILAMLIDTMVPEAVADTHEAAGAIAALGFLVAFAPSHGGA
ncbi:hypothetical protein RM530_17540 [Algiphilus sp. W345]|uniref:ZIP family zinc transporter n=1 Tax=Banduia mediterranea TaxID=3075609 RepID=A0ABU2WPH0_9GAMM|nr:hypothetical protein [Algiphilus sp. W345]MDT0499149.1 hypothetical protein [Algiphilus sp. W345]